MDTHETQEAEQAWANLTNQAVNLESELNPTNEILPVNETATEPEISTAELLAPVIKVTADILAPNWALDESECEQLGIAYGSLIDKYLPDNPASKYGLEISAVMITLAVFGSRKGMPMRLEKKEKQALPGQEKNEILETAGDDKQVILNQSENGVLMPKAVSDES